MKTITSDYSDCSPSLGPKFGRSISPWKKLAICLFIDGIRILHYLFNFIPNAEMMMWAPITAILNYNLFGNLLLSSFAVIEEFLPLLDMLPTATLAWFYLGHETEGKDQNNHDDLEEVKDRQYVPLDDFILEVLVHCLNSYLMTVFILMAPSPLTFVMEVVILLLLVGDVMADIIFAGIEDNTESITEGIKNGLKEIFEDHR